VRTIPPAFSRVRMAMEWGGIMPFTWSIVVVANAQVLRRVDLRRDPTTSTGV
jgi:hypothetical protein